MEKRTHRPVGVTLLVIFFAFGATMCGLTILLLVYPDTTLDAAWRLKPLARDELMRMGAGAVLTMLVTGCACALAAIGLACGLEWGRRLAIAVLVINVLGDTINAFIRHDWWTLIGLPIGGAMIYYLLSRPVVEWIARRSKQARLTESC